MRGRRDYITIALATAGVLAAISLAGIFIVYLIDTIGGDDKPANAQVTGGTSPTGPTFPGGTSLTGPSTPGTPAPGPSAPGAAGGGAGGSAAAGGGGNRANLIPDNQQYVTYKGVNWTVSYPKGWTQGGSSTNTRWVQGLDGLSVITGKGPRPTVSDVGTQLAKNKGVRIAVAPKEVQLNGKPAIKTTLRQVIERQQGKARIVIDDYRFADKGRSAILQVKCPAGVYPGNKDDFNKIVNSFNWK